MGISRSKVFEIASPRLKDDLLVRGHGELAADPIYSHSPSTSWHASSSTLPLCHGTSYVAIVHHEHSWLSLLDFGPFDYSSLQLLDKTAPLFLNFESDGVVAPGSSNINGIRVHVPKF